MKAVRISSGFSLVCFVIEEFKKTSKSKPCDITCSPLLFLKLSPLNNHTSDESGQNNSYGPYNTEARYRRGSTESHIEDGKLPVLPGQPYTKKPHKVLTTHSVDRFSRILMPAIYATFVVGYWVVCAALSPQREALDLC